MSFTRENLTVIGNSVKSGNVPTLFSYYNEDDDTVTSADFFSDRRIRVGDQITVYSSDKTTVANYYVSAITELAGTATVISSDTQIDDLVVTSLTSSGKLQVDDTTDATNTTDGSLQTDGGLSVAKNAVIGGDIYNKKFTDYSSTSVLTGWSSTTTKEIWYKKVGNLVFVNFEISGTSDAVSARFTLPYTCNTYISSYSKITGVDNGSDAPQARALVASSQSYIDIHNSSLGANGWTSSGIKTVIGQIFYEAQ